MRDLDRIREDAALVRADKGASVRHDGKQKSESEAILESPRGGAGKGRVGVKQWLDCLVMSNANSQSTSLFACMWHNASATQLIGDNQPLP